ncbi:hypothetical protein QBC33DRAFT_618615 [Phialemonium atrogriseum]|uniref:Uncharacterized protein n=1 Tax=Phialemonium atrogriseum TaxID=1093897 RepID=A0AAJ0C1Y9_9PEZI|nr:uncharacterized protein QBC33DRAFT_618615 [Phialemonium atrogriseum]KAK1768406.1 hypothetical protein QBC33DRAFT_618615 [Phialemonium atrogriseum]
MCITNAPKVFTDTAGFPAGYGSYSGQCAATDVYPPSFVQRVDRCVEMLAGIIAARGGAAGAHGSRHLYNMMGGKVYKVDFMFARPVNPGPANALDFSLLLRFPSTDKGGVVEMVIPPKEEEFIKQALDCLPWAPLSWSIHRGMRDILVVYAKPVMDSYRGQLAAKLKRLPQRGRLS